MRARFFFRELAVILLLLGISLVASIVVELLRLTLRDR